MTYIPTCMPKFQTPDDMPIDDKPIEEELDEHQNNLLYFAVFILIPFIYMTGMVLLNRSIRINILLVLMILVFGLGFVGITVTSSYMDYIKRKHNHIIEEVKKNVKHNKD